MIPTELKVLDQWLCWKDVSHVKIPVVAATGHNASSTDPKTWCDFGMADACRSAYDGLGFVFRPGGGIVGMDLDCCLSETGELAAWARPLLAMFPTYAEVSPSGRGIKLFLRGDISKATKSKWYPCGKPEKGVKHGPAVEVYSGGRYFTVTGNLWSGSPTEIVDCQSSLDFLISAHLVSPVYVRRTVYERNGTDAAFRRAESYVSRIPGAVSGQSGHDATFKVAQHLVRGFDLDYDDAMSIISDWNLKCEPPWEDRDIERKISEAITKSKLPHGYLLTDRQDNVPIDTGVNLDGILIRKNEVVEVVDDEDDDEDDLSEGSKASPEIPAACLRPPGLLAELIDFKTLTAKFPQPELALASSLSMLSLLTGRRVEDSWGTRTNLMIAAIAVSRSGKEYGRLVNKRILELHGVSHMYEESLASNSALHGFLNESPAGLLMCDEFGDFLAMARQTKGSNTQPAQIVSSLVKLFSSSGQTYKAARYAENSKQVVINQPHLVLYGTSTASVFWKHVTPDYLTGGLFGRLLVFEGRGYVDPKDVYEVSRSIPESIYKQVGQWLGFNPGGGKLQGVVNPTPYVMAHTDDARKRFVSHEFEICKRRKHESEVVAVLWSGTAENTAKLAELFGCSRCSDPSAQRPLIELCDVELAILLSNHLTRRKVEFCIDYVAETEHENDLKRVLRIIKESGTAGIPHHRLTKKCQRMPDRTFKEILNSVITSRQVFLDTIKTGGTPKRVYVWRGHRS